MKSWRKVVRSQMKNEEDLEIFKNRKAKAGKVRRREALKRKSIPCDGAAPKYFL